MSSRGFMHGFEYRATPTDDTKLWMRLDSLYDQKVNNDVNDGAYKHDSFVRENSNRYWLRGMLDTAFEKSDWRLKANFDYVSDQDYIREFKNTYGGHKRSRNDLFDWFSRDLTEQHEDRKSAALLARDFERGTISLFGEYIQDPSFGHGNRNRSSDTSVQSGPQVDAFLHKGRIFPAFPLEVDVTAQAGHFYRKKGTQGARYDLLPTLTLPITGRYGSIIASGGVRQTIYSTENAELSRPSTSSAYWERQAPSREEGEHRTLPEIALAASTELARAYNFGNAQIPLTQENIGESNWQGLRHSIQPRVEYNVRAHEYQSENPYYDATDRLAPRHEITYSLTNLLTRKQQRVVMQKNEQGVMVPQYEDRYIELVRLDLEQSYDLREADRNHLSDRFERRPFGDAKGEITFGLTPYIRLHSKTHYSPYENKLTRYQSSTSFSHPSYGNFALGYDERLPIDEYNRKRSNRLRYVTTQANVNLWENAFTLSTLYNQDFEDANNKEIELGVTYNHQCFALSAKAIVDEEETSYWFSIRLAGF